MRSSSSSRVIIVMVNEEIDPSVARKYEIGKKVGCGAYGVVWLAWDRKTRKQVAVKKIFDAFQNSTDAQRTYREIAFLQELNIGRHSNIIKLLNVLKAENDADIYLVFEYLEIALHSVIKANILQDLHRRFIVYQCLRALLYIHSGDLLHRDLKPSNILINSDCTTKLCDFGLARSVAEQQTAAAAGTSTLDNSSSAVLTDYVATRWYRAPEILLGSHAYSKSVDMWSIGCIMAGKKRAPAQKLLLLMLVTMVLLLLLTSGADH